MSLVGTDPTGHRPAEGAAAALRTHDRGARARARSCCDRAARATRAGSACDDDALQTRRGRGRRRHPDALPRPEDPVPQPLAPLRGRRRGPQGRARCTLADWTRRRAHLIDLAVVSVLLDAGAGPDWHYQRGRQRQASPAPRDWRGELHAFMGGLFSSDPAHPLRVGRGRLCAALDTGPAGRGLPGRSRPIRWSAWTAGWCCCAGWARRWPRSPRCSARRAGRAACSTCWSTPPRHGGRARHPVAAPDCRCRASGRRTTRSVLSRSATAGATRPCAAPA